MQRTEKKLSVRVEMGKHRLGLHPWTEFPGIEEHYIQEVLTVTMKFQVHGIHLGLPGDEFIEANGRVRQGCLVSPVEHYCHSISRLLVYKVLKWPWL